MRTQKKKAQLRRRNDKLWATLILKRNPNCEVCGKKATDAHHFIPKGLSSKLRYSRNNGVSLCRGCHFALHTKSDPTIVSTIIEKRGKIWLKKLKQIKGKKPSISTNTIRWYEETYEKLKKSYH